MWLQNKSANFLPRLSVIMHENIHVLILHHYILTVKFNNYCYRFLEELEIHLRIPYLLDQTLQLLFILSPNFLRHLFESGG